MEIDPKQIDWNRKSVTILSVCGGGARVMIPIAVLDIVEEVTGEPVIETFDLFCGSSSGAMIVGALNVPNSDKTSKFSVQWLKENYVPHVAHLLKPKFLRMCMAPFRPFFDSQIKKRLIKDLIGDLKVKDFLKTTIVVATDANKAHPFFVSGGVSNVPYGGEYLARDVLSASCAHPMMFESVPLKKLGTNDWMNLIDGGMTAKDPVLIAVTAARKQYPKAQIKVLNLGSGELELKGFGKKPMKWGTRKWKKPLFSMQMIMNSSMMLVSDLIGDVGGSGEGCSVEHLSINPVFPKKFPRPFATDKKSFRLIEDFAIEFAEDQREVLIKFFNPVV